MDHQTNLEDVRLLCPLKLILRIEKIPLTLDFAEVKVIL